MQNSKYLRITSLSLVEFSSNRRYLFSLALRTNLDVAAGGQNYKIKTANYLHRLRAAV